MTDEKTGLGPLSGVARRASLVLALVAAGGLVPATAHAATPLTIGTGHKPNVAVDSAGTAYITWHWQNSPDTSIKFCRLPRGATACDLARSIPGTGAYDSIQRSFVTVAGSIVRVFQYRSGPSTGMIRYESKDGGSSWDGGSIVGSVPMEEAVPGPGATLSGVTQAHNEGTVFQNVPAGGGSAGDARADLDVGAEYPYNGTVGLVDGPTPLVVFNNGSHLARARRYDGSGPLNSAAKWTPAVDLGYAAYPQLAGGPTGLILLAESSDETMGARRWDGTTFGPAVSIAPGDAPNSHLAQDAAGRLHAVFQQGTAAGLHLIHATSDDGANWQAGALLTSGDGGIADPRVATASDHVGVVVWETRTAAGPQIRVTAVGPTAPVAPDPVLPVTRVLPGPPARRTATLAPRRRPPATARRLRGGRVKVTVAGRLGVPTDVSAAQACRGRLNVVIRRGKRKVGSHRATVKPTCRYRTALTLGRRKLKRARRLTMTLRFAGNDLIAPVSRTYNLKIKARRP